MSLCKCELTIVIFLTVLVWPVVYLVYPYAYLFLVVNFLLYVIDLLSLLILMFGTWNNLCLHFFVRLVNSGSVLELVFESSDCDLKLLRF